MIYLVNSCITYENNSLASIKLICGGWCCYMLDFKEFPHGRWHSNSCSSLVEGVCIHHIERPVACEGSPFYDGGPHLWPPNKFIVPWCAYRRQVLDHHGIPYEILESGEECILRYSKEGLGDFERWTERRYYKRRTIFYERGKTHNS